MRARILLVCICIPLVPVLVQAQYRDDDQPRIIDERYPGARPEGHAPPPRRLIYNPTASTLPRGYFDIDLRIFGIGGVLAGTNIGLTNRFQVGVSYGAEGLLGEGDPVWNDRVGFRLKLQLFEEKYRLPAIAVGYDDQGYGRWVDAANRYTVKSKGAYAVISKNFYTLHVATGFHGGVNQSFEDGDGDKSPDLFLGWDFSYNRDISILLEYMLGFNDNAADSLVLGKGRGYLNLGVRWVYSDRLVLEADLTNLLMNRKTADNVGREVRIVYLEEF